MLFALAVAVMALGAVRLGAWQFDRLEDREQRNEWTERNLAAAPAPLDAVLAVGEPVPADREWTRVRVTGQYDADASVVVRYRTRDGNAGVDLVTPLVTASGTAVLVDRGWIPTDNTGAVPADLPQPPPGQVDVVGWVRSDATGRGIEVADSSTRAVSSVEIGKTLDYPVYAGFLEAESESPPPADEVQRTQPPDLGAGPHFFYGLQWWFFGALAVFGFGYLAWDERRQRRRTPQDGEVRGDPVSRA